MPFQAALLSIKPAPAARSAATKFLFWAPALLPKRHARKCFARSAPWVRRMTMALARASGIKPCNGSCF